MMTVSAKCFSGGASTSVLLYPFVAGGGVSFLVISSRFKQPFRKGTLQAKSHIALYSLNQRKECV